MTEDQQDQLVISLDTQYAVAHAIYNRFHAHISQFNPESVVMDNGDTLIISRGYRAQVSEELLSRSASLPV